MRQPSRRLLQQTITLYNELPNNTIINGGTGHGYARTVLQGVRYVQREGAIRTASGGAVSDSLYVMIFPAMLIGCTKQYVSPEEYAAAFDGDRAGMWTLKKGADYIALGAQDSDRPSTDGSESRNDFVITTVDIRYNPDGSIHHFEVNAR